MTYRTLIFDLDGTLLDTSPGIFATANRTMIALGLEPEHDRRQLSKFIGPPIIQCFENTYHLPERYRDEAVRIYRKAYRAEGQYDAFVYPHMAETLQLLHDKGYVLAVGTLKVEDIARNMLGHFGIASLFSSIRGADEKGKFDKADIIAHVVEELGSEPEETLLVGDTLHDMIGAEKAGVGFVAVDYGFGFPRGQRPEKTMLAVAPDPQSLPTILEHLPIR